LLDADEAFVTNSIMGVMPVCRIERKVIGDDRPGPITMQLAAEYAKAMHA
jgi:branched-chain amino acid aminotransferase